MLYPDAKCIEIQDNVLSSSLRLDFETPAHLFLGPIYGTSSTAAPEFFQGIRIFPFWKLSVESLKSARYGINVHLFQRKRVR